MIEKEFALSGSEQNPDITDRDLRLLLKSRLGRGAQPPVEAFKQRGADFVVAGNLRALVAGMNGLTPQAPLDYDRIERQIVAARRGNSQPVLQGHPDHRASTTAAASWATGCSAPQSHTGSSTRQPGPLIAVRLHIVTRKTLGGIQTDLDGQAFAKDGSLIDGLYAAGEAAGFGGGGAHGYNALEGSFLGGCIFTGRTVGRALARRL